MGPHGIYGHLPDSLHAWGHPATFMECVQARFMRFWGDHVFSEGFASDYRQKEGVTRIRNAQIKTPPDALRRQLVPKTKISSTLL